MNDFNGDVMINHNRFTLLNRQADKLFDLAKKKGIKIFNAAPFCGGILAKGTKETNRLVYQEVSEKKLKPVLFVRFLTGTSVKFKLTFRNSQIARI